MANSTELSQRLKDFKVSYESTNLASVTSGKDTLSTTLTTITGKIDNIISLFKTSGNDSVINSIVSNVSLCKDATDRIKSHVDSDVDAVLGQIEGVVGTITEIEELIKTVEEVKNSLNSAKNVKEGEEPDQARIDSLNRRIDNLGLQIEDKNSKGETQLNAIQAAMDGISLGIAGNMQAGGVLGANYGFNDNYQSTCEDLTFPEEEETEEKAQDEYSATGGIDGKSFTSIDDAVKDLMKKNPYLTEEDARSAIERAIEAGAIRIKPVPEDDIYSATGGKDGKSFTSIDDAVKDLMKKSPDYFTEEDARAAIERAIEAGAIRIKPVPEDDIYSATGGIDGKSFTSIDDAVKDLMNKSPDYYTEEDARAAIERAIEAGTIKIKPVPEDDTYSATGGKDGKSFTTVDDAVKDLMDKYPNSFTEETARETIEKEIAAGNIKIKVTSEEAVTSATDVDENLLKQAALPDKEPQPSNDGEYSATGGKDGTKFTTLEDAINAYNPEGDNYQRTREKILGMIANGELSVKEELSDILQQRVDEIKQELSESAAGGLNNSQDASEDDTNGYKIDGIKLGLGKSYKYESRDKAVESFEKTGLPKEDVEKIVDLMIESGDIIIEGQTTQETPESATQTTAANVEPPVVDDTYSATGGKNGNSFTTYEDAVNREQDTNFLPEYEAKDKVLNMIATGEISIKEKLSEADQAKVDAAKKRFLELEAAGKPAKVADYSATGGKDGKCFTTYEDAIKSYQNEGMEYYAAEDKVIGMMNNGEMFILEETPEKYKNLIDPNPIPPEDSANPPEAPANPTEKPPIIDDNVEFTPTGGSDHRHFTSREDIKDVLMKSNPNFNDEEVESIIDDALAKGSIIIKEPAPAADPLPAAEPDPYAGQEYSPTGGELGNKFTTLNDATNKLMELIPGIDEDEAYKRVCKELVAGNIYVQTDPEVIPNFQETIKSGTGRFKLESCLVVNGRVYNGSKENPIYFRKDRDNENHYIMCNESGQKLSGYEGVYIDINDILNAE